MAARACGVLGFRRAEADRRRCEEGSALAARRFGVVRSRGVLRGGSRPVLVDESAISCKSISTPVIEFTVWQLVELLAEE